LLKQSQEGLKVVVISCICFAVTITVALVITIAVLPPQVSFATVYFSGFSIWEGVHQLMGVKLIFPSSPW